MKISKKGELRLAAKTQDKQKNNGVTQDLQCEFKKHADGVDERMNILTKQVDRVVIAVGENERGNKTWKAKVERQGKEERKAFDIAQDQK